MKNSEVEKRELLLKRLRKTATPVVEPEFRSAMPKADRTQALPLSFAQQRLWFIDQLEKNSTAYHIPGGVRLLGALDRQVLQRALDAVLERHEVLRTVFVSANGPVAQVIVDDAKFALQWVDLSDRGAEEREAELSRQVDEVFGKPFELSTGPLIRGRLICLGAREHVLLVAMHHIVSDGWSMGVFIREVAQLYAAFRDGRGNTLPPLPVQYADYTVWQRKSLQGEALKRQIEYWKRQLHAPPGQLELPTDRQRPAAQSYRGGSVEFSLDAGLSNRLRVFSRQHDVTLFMTLYAGFAILLSRLSSQDDVVIGTPVANRQRTELEGLIGFFVNTLALRVLMTADQSVAALLQQVKATTLGAYSHQELPFEQVVEATQPQRSLRHSPIFQVLIALQNAPSGESELPDLMLSPFVAESSTSQFDLTLSLSEVGEQIVGSLNYASDLFDEATIQRWAGHLRHLLDEMSQDSKRAVHALNLLSAREREQLLRDFNATRTVHPRETRIHELFEEQATATPEAIAVNSADEQLTYRQLDERSNQLAHFLREHGVGPDRLVAICVDRSAELVVGLLGVLKAGGAYVPLDPEYPRERLDYMLKDAAPAVVLTLHRLEADLPGSEATVIALDTRRSEIAQRPTRRLSASKLGLESEHLAYVIHTSGSTGQPKGVMIEHANVVNFLRHMRGELAIGPTDRLLAVTTLSFDIAALEIFLPLISGAQLALASREVAADARALSGQIDEFGATFLQATPATWRLLLSAGWAGRHALKALCGGEALPVDLATQLRPLVGSLSNLYGPTETTIWSCSRKVVAAAGGSRVIESIGRPIANTQVYILDEKGQLAPIGVTGEIYIGGAGVARGYLNRPELTAERFVRDPFSSVPTARMYKTGDLGRWASDGTIDYLGRNDQQVKVRGFRIELGEIEAQLNRHPAVRQSVVVAREAVPGDRRLVGYIVPRSAEELKERAEAALSFSLFYFGADSYSPESKYELYLESAKFADAHGFEAIWTPERHFDAVGSLYPNPSLLSAALATLTRRVKLRAGSVVLPLHDPIRAAEEWAVVDNLSGGRTGVAIASGWHPRDFVLAPENFIARKQAVSDGIQELNELWAGRSVMRKDGNGKDVEVRIFPKPIQERLPMWLTAAGNPETFIEAGRLGIHVLTHLLGQTIEELSGKIALYRQALREHGHDPERGRVTVMVHTFLGNDSQKTLEQARPPFMAYMRAHLGLLKALVQSLGMSTENVSAADLENITAFAFERYVRTASLIGTPAETFPVVNHLREIGVDEIGCLIDWMDSESALAGLDALRQLRELARTAPPTARELKAHCGTALPDYMIPSAFVSLEALPLTPNGKVDRRALPAPELSAFAVKQYEAPQGEIEESLALLWQELLQIERVGRHDNFFELGGHSLLAVLLMNRVQQMLGRELELRALFEHPTLQGLARQLSSKERITVMPMRRADRSKPLPLSWAQQRLWFIDQLEGGNAAYHVPGGVRLSGVLDPAALQAALDTMLVRHETLRTVFATVDGEPVQIIAENVRFSLKHVDLSGLEPADREDTVAQQAAEEAKDRFDLRVGPVIRGRLIRLGELEHVLLVTMHHIVSDGWSMGVFIREAAQLYAAYCEGRENPLPALPFQYVDYAVWQREWLQGKVLEDQLSYWSRQLGGAPTLLELPTDRPRPAVQSYRGASIDFELGAELTDQMKRFSLQHDVTPFMTIYAAMSILLSRLSGQEDVVIGTPTANRQRTEVEQQIGFFTNTLALRAQLGDDPSVRALLQQVKSVTLGAYSHQELPFERVVEALKPTRTLSHSPVFQAMLVLQIAGQGVIEAPGLRLSSQPAPIDTAQFDLLLSIEHIGENIACSINYASDLFDRQTVLRWAESFRLVSEQMVRNPDQRISAIGLLDARQREQLLREFNATAVEYPQDRLIHELFEDQVAKTPDAIAVTCESQHITYRELNERSNQLAHHLRECGIGPDGLVAICVERSLEMVVGLLGILKAGGAYVPLDPGYPRERLEYMLKDASPAVLLTQESLKALLPEISATLIALDKQWDEIARHSKGNVSAAQLRLNRNHLAYVIYTSGSTGQPKGAMNEHGAVVNRLQWMQQAYQLTPNDRVMQKTPFSFDVSVWEFFWTLLNGATLVVARPQGHQDPGYLSELIATEGITTLHFVPSMLQVFLEHGGARGCDSLRQVICSGEALSVELQNRCLQLLPQAKLHNLYGPTEAAIDVTYWECRTEPAQARVPIGHPIANTQIYLLDRHRQPVPLGVIGELYIGGAGVARGYLNRPELTAECFLADPFSPTPEARIYKSGDLGRYRPDGTIEYLGRNDTQVKIRGFRIELGEIEAKLAQYPQVKDAVVLAREDVPGEKRLVAYLTHTDPAPGSEELRSHLKSQLPEYMLPSAYVLLDRLPLTANGKLDRKALPAPELGAYATKVFEAPQGATEIALATIWQELLQIERVGRNDNFFELGGHSLLIVRMIERLRRAGLTTEVRRAFNSPSLAVLAASLAKDQGSAFKAPPNLIPAGCESITPEMLPLIELRQAQIDRIVRTVPGGAANVQDLYPLAPLQEGLLFHHVLNEDRGDVYVMPTLLAAKSRAHLDALLDAIQRVIDRHDIWRTSVLWKDLPRAVQVVHRQARLPVEELTVESGRDAIEQLKERMAPGRLRIDLRSAPLVRALIAQSSDSGHWSVLLYYHHIISDHMALERILDEVDAHLEGSGTELAASIPYREYVAYALERARTHDATAFFRQRLGDIDEPTAPFGLLDVGGDGSRIEEARQGLEVELSKRIRHSAQRLNVSPAALFHAAFALVVAHTSGREDVVFGSVFLGRMNDATGIQQMLGMFINTLPVRLALSGLSSRQLVQQTRDELAQLLEYEHAPLAEAQGCSGIVGHAPLFSAVLNYRHSIPAHAGRRGADDSGVGMLASHERTNYPITVSVDDLGDGFEITAQIDRQIDARRVASYVHATIGSLVHALDNHPDAPALDVSILPTVEREQLLREFNATAVEYPQDRLIHELFEEQVTRTPDAIAVAFESQQLTYRQLSERSNQLAHYLRQHGIGPDRLVAICVERSLEMVVGLLGILKAGGAYVPLDPGYPRERLEYMLKDASPAVLLTQESLKSSLPDTAATLIALDTQWSEIAKQPTQELSRSEQELTSHHLAYVIYTSGSTGQPKGAMNEHGAVVNRLRWMQQAYELTPKDRVLQKTPFSFDVSVWEFFWTLLNGACLVVARPQGHQDPEYLRELMNKEGITTAHFVPSMLQVFLEHGATQGCASLRQVICSGEALSVELQNRCLELLPQAKLHNLYGPTEAAIDVTYWECRTEPGESRVPIGRPIANTQIYILDHHRQPVPIGVAGEIHIGGVGVARGYLNRPELTAERFLADPFSPTPEARIYKSGDLARYRPDGTIEYLGRNDTQVKIRGFRIELGEIEAKLSQHPQVKDVVVLAREDAPGEKRLVAYLTHTESAPGSEELRSYLKPQLPEYMIPSAYVLLESLPLTANGKLDRKALPTPELGAYATKVYAAPQGQVETALATIWQELLQIERVGRHDNFFELGGHSLLAVRLVNAIQTRLSLSVSLRTFMDAPTVAQLASCRSQNQDDEAPLLQLIPDPANLHEPFPLTHVQLAYWIGRKDVAELGSVGAHSYAEIPVRGVDPDRFEAAFNRLIRHHGQLRMIVTPSGEQRVLADVPNYRIAVNDLRGMTPEGAKESLLEVRTELSHQVFSGETWPLFDIRLSRLTDDELIIHRSTDALMLDASSSEILAKDLVGFYDEPASELPSLDLNFRDYVLALKRFEGTARFRRAKDYWLARLPDFPERPDLPLATDPGQIKQPQFERRSHFVPGRQWQRLVALAKQHQITPTVLFLSCFTEVLQQWSQQRRFALNLTLFNRIAFHPQVDAIVGDFTTLTLLEMDYSATLRWVDRLRATQQQLWSDLEHRYFDGLQMIQALRQASGTPVSFPVVVTSTIGLYQQDAQGEETPDALIIAAAEQSRERAEEESQSYGISQTSQVWLDVQVSERGSGLYYAWDSVVGLFPEGMLDAMFSSLSGLLERLAADPDCWSRPMELGLPQAHADTVMAANSTGRQFEGGLLHSPLVQQIARQHGKVAVRTAHKALSYDELGARSRQLAVDLIAGGASPNRLVAVVMEKCWQQVVAVLGIVRAGAAYLPIDASLPGERIALLLENGEVEQVVTTPQYAKFLPPQYAKLHLIEDEFCARDESTASALSDRATPEDLAYVIFTSGSTGMPKGVMIEHGAALNTIRDINERYEVSSGDSVFGLSNLSFDLSVYDIFGVLGAGGTLVLPLPEEYKEPQSWLRYLHPSDTEPVTLWNTVPALMQMLVDYVAGQDLELPLRTVMMSGDWIPLDLPARIRTLAPQARLISLGGATEASIWSIEYPIQHMAEDWRSVPYGKALANQAFYVLQADLSLAPLWVAGDLYIGGIGLARGYWRDAAKTGHSFIRHPRSGERLYRTGDRGRLWPDGNIEFLGRIDQQVKIQGFRIELGEIEARLKAHPLVGDAVAVAHRIGRSTQLLAYVVGQPVEEDRPAGGQESGYRPLSAAEKIEFKLANTAVRPIDARSMIDLRKDDSEVLSLRSSRSSEDADDTEPVTLDALSALLRAFHRRSYPQRQFAKAFYPSGGTLYAVQVYLEVAADRVRLTSGGFLAPGYYYYHPLTHQLMALRDGSPGTAAARGRSAPEVFRVMLVADHAAIRPLYGSLSDDLCGLEAGYMSNLLELESDSGLALRAEDAEFFDCRAIPGTGPQHCLLTVHSGASRNTLAVQGAAISPDNVRCVLYSEECRFDLPASPAVLELSLRARKSYRQYLAEAPSIEAMGWMLSALTRSSSEDGLTLYVRLHREFSSRSGGTLGPGTYVYDNAGALLRRATEGALAPGASLFNGDSRQIELGASFSLFLVGDRIAAQKKYLAAGAAGQRLSNHAPAVHIGLCAIGVTDSLALCAALQLSADQHVYHAILGGAITAEQMSSIEDTVTPREDLEREILDFLRAGLPHYMVPQRIIPLASIPLTANGKVDRKALPVPEMNAASDAQHQAPEGETELTLAAMWIDLLQLERVGRRDNFFDLGGHSLLAVHLLMRVRDQLSVTLPVSAVFESPTIAELTERIQAVAELARTVEQSARREASKDRVEEGWV